MEEGEIGLIERMIMKKINFIACILVSCLIFSFCKGGDKKSEPKVEVAIQEDPLTLQVFPGPTPLEVVERYARSIGTTILPPSWVFGPWRWRDEIWDLPSFYNGTVYNGPYNSMIVEDILMMRALGIPCTLYWVDRPWAESNFGYNDLTWDHDRLPQPLKMIEWLEDMGIKFMLWIAPWVMGEMAEEAVTKGYNTMAEIPSPPFDAKLLDLTNPDAVSWWQDALMGRINEGVVGFKLDRGEEKVPDGKIITGNYHDGRSFREVRNAYPSLYAAAIHGAFERAGVDEFVIMPRSAWVGTQRHAVIWGGDTKPSEYGLRSAVIALQRNAAMNFPIWGSDTCGYGLAEREVCARWLAFSAFCPLMEVGSTGNIAPWSTVPEGESGGVGSNGYNYTPFYDEELVAIWIFYANLHKDLADYSFRQAELCREQGTPIVRPMIFAYPDRKEYRDLFSSSSQSG